MCICRHIGLKHILYFVTNDIIQAFAKSLLHYHINDFFGIKSFNAKIRKCCINMEFFFQKIIVLIHHFSYLTLTPNQNTH